VVKNKTVLVVDDSRMARMMIKKIILSHYPDWEMLEAQSAKEALQLSEGKSIDIMTLDLNMPGMDGLDLGAEMRKRFPNADISLVTANIQEAVQQKASDERLTFVPKPITEERIMGYIQAVA